MSFGGAAAALNKTIKKNRKLLRSRKFHNTSEFKNFEFEGCDEIEVRVLSPEERQRIASEKKAINQRKVFKIGVVLTVAIMIGVFVWINWM